MQAEEEEAREEEEAESTGDAARVTPRRPPMCSVGVDTTAAVAATADSAMANKEELICGSATSGGRREDEHPRSVATHNGAPHTPRSLATALQHHAAARTRSKEAKREREGTTHACATQDPGRLTIFGTNLYKIRAWRGLQRPDAVQTYLYFCVRLSTTVYDSRRSSCIVVPLLVPLVAPAYDRSAKVGRPHAIAYPTR